MTATPQTFDDLYELTKTLGEGAFGKVYQYKRRDNNEEYAVKSMVPGKMPLDMIQNEVDVCFQLQHPNVIRLFQYFINEANCMHHLVFELASDGELYDDIYTKECYTEVEGSHCFEQILQGLAYIHKQRIVHRDLKADNILLHETGNRIVVKIADFGAAIRLSEDESFEFIGKLEDTGYWMAPEMPLRLVCSLSVDLWACGTMLHIIIYGLPPFNGEGETLLGEMLNAEYLFSEDNKDDGVSDDVKDLIAKFLITDRDHRMSADEALKDPFIVRHRNASSRFYRPKEYAKSTERRVDEDHTGTSGVKTIDKVRDEADIQNEQTLSLAVLEEERGSADKDASKLDIARASTARKKYLKSPNRDLKEVRRTNVNTTLDKSVAKNKQTSSVAVLKVEQDNVKKGSPLQISPDSTVNKQHLEASTGDLKSRASSHRFKQVTTSAFSNSLQSQDKLLKSRKRSAPKVSTSSLMSKTGVTDDIVPLKRSGTVIGFSNKPRFAGGQSIRPSSIACGGRGATIVHGSKSVQTSTSSEINHRQMKKEHPKNVKSFDITKPYDVAAPELESPISPDLHLLV